MGFDITGRQPDPKKSGHYFRANVWSWRPICGVMQQAGCDVPESWHMNDGAGLSDAMAIEILADQIEAFMARKADEDVFFLDTDYKCSIRHPDGTVVEENPYRVYRDHLAAWVEFLRNCNGGFEIW